MKYEIKNEFLSVKIRRYGAELQSIMAADGTEYLWQGDPKYWADRSPNLFPYIGRMIGKQYEYNGQVYPMDIHGIALYSDFEVMEHTDTSILFCLKSSDQSLTQFPWNFVFTIRYSLCGNRLDIGFTVDNKDKKTMLFAVGGHPGFNIPLNPGEVFEDYRLRFSESSLPQRIIFTPDCYVDTTVPYEMEGGNTIALRHDLFDQDAIVLKTDVKAVTLESIRGGKSVTVSYPQMDYIGFWHEKYLDCPYVCIEPWSSLPSPKGEKTVLENQKDLLRLEAGQSYINNWSIELN